jgi:hypothetical protein
MAIKVQIMSSMSSMGNHPLMPWSVNLPHIYNRIPLTVTSRLFPRSVFHFIFILSAHWLTDY